MKLHYNPDLVEKARQLRKSSTVAEVMLWKKLRARQMRGHKFLRQKPIDNYIVDFYCRKLKLVIEIDGLYHNDFSKADGRRDKVLQSLGLEVLRFTNAVVKCNIEKVLKVIEEKIDSLAEQDV